MRMRFYSSGGPRDTYLVSWHAIRDIEQDHRITPWQLMANADTRMDI